MELLEIRTLVADLARRALEAAGDVAVSANHVSLGLAAGHIMLADDSRLHAQLVGGFKALASIGKSTASGSAAVLSDAAGHRREIYHPLVVHLHLAAFDCSYENMTSSLWSACEDAIPDAIRPARSIEAYTDTAPPRHEVDLVLWNSLCVLEEATLLSRDVDVEIVDAVVHSALGEGGRGGALHAYDPDESLDTWTYRELTGLHALANLALRRRNTAWARRVQEIALYHLENTQPDYTTYEPWALFAFSWSPQTVSFAEQQIHDASTHLASLGAPQARSGAGIVAALLLTDAAAALALFD